MAAKAPSKTTKPAEDNAAEQATVTSTAAPAVAPAVTPSPVEAPAAPAEPGAIDGQAVVSTSALTTSVDGQFIVPAALVQELTPAPADSAVGNAAAIVPDDEPEYPEPWLGLQRAVSDVAIERLRQVSTEGFALEADDAHTSGQLARAASCYLIAPAGLPTVRARINWPFDPNWFKPGLIRSDLVKAAALIVAEIERLDRAEDAA